MKSLLASLGDLSGHLGEVTDFNVSDTEEQFLITAHLPGHKMDQMGRGSDPLAVFKVGESIVVKGRHTNGRVMFEFQRSFRIPLRARGSDVIVEYSTTSGKLVVRIAKRPRLDGEEDDYKLAERPGAQPTAFPELQRSLSEFFGEGQRLGGQGNLRSSAAPPDPQRVQDLFSSVVEEPHRAHTVSARVKDDNTTYLGCFGEDELPTNRTGLQVPSTGQYSGLKQLARGALDPRGDRFFAVALHPQPSAGVASAFAASPHMPPRFGTGRCGRPCLYETDGLEPHWCGCTLGAPREADGCPAGLGPRFAVYLLPLQDGLRARLPRSRPVWQLGEDADGTPTLEVHAPPGRKLKQDAGRLLVVKDERHSSSSDHSGDEPPKASATSSGSTSGGARTADGAAAGGTAVAPSDHLGHVGVPVDLSEHDCAFSEGGSQMKCRLKEERVKEIPVHYTKDEL